MSYELKSQAEQDLEDIAEYSFLNFGIQQAERYRDSLLSCFSTLADNPQLGVDVGKRSIAPMVERNVDIRND